MKRLLSTIVIILFIPVCLQSQRSLIEIEEYYLLELLQSAKQNNIQSLTESNNTQSVLRKWIFDNEGKLKKEIDNREMIVTSIIGEIEHKTPSTKASIYNLSLIHI